MIKLNRVEIQNYRQYKKINLNFESKKGLFLFIGKNGRGKSNFLNAICWCLYGDEPFKEPEDKAIILNDDVSKEGKKYIEIFVKIEIITDDKTYLFHRSIYQNSDGDTQAEAFNVSTRNNDQQDSKIAENPEFIVKKILPKKIRKFFLFDGEAVQKLFEGDYAPNLKESIYEVSDIELLRVSLDHVTATENPISKRAYRDDPKASSLEEKKTELINLVKEKSIEHSKLENSTKELQKNIDRLRVKQEEYRKYKNLFERRTELKNRDKEIRNSINSNRPFPETMKEYYQAQLDHLNKQLEND